MDLIKASFELEATAFVVLLLLFIAGSGVVFLLARAVSSQALWRSLVSLTPSTLATVGVIGTFYGIWFGLQDFDVSAIDESVPILLEGLKTAFVTSLWGMALSVLFRVLSAIVPARSSGGSNALEAMTKLLDEQKRTREVSEAGFETLRQVLAGDDDSTLVSQLKRLRVDQADRLQGIENGIKVQTDKLSEDSERQHQEHITELRDFAKHMVENTHRSLIEALEGVIRDFNNKLTEQFGENFRELNAAVGKLVTWQDQYREHIEQLETRIDLALQGTERAAQSLSAIESSADAIPTAIEPLAPVLQTIEETLSRLHEDLEAHADLHDKARAALPLVNQNLESMTDGLRDAVSTMIERSENAMERQNESQATLASGYGRLLAESEHAQHNFTSAVDKTMQEVNDALSKACTQMSNDMEASLAKTDQQMKTQIQELDNRLGEELERALGMMANNLGSMSKHFVDDYEPLTRQLGEIVNIAQAANHKRR